MNKIITDILTKTARWLTAGRSRTALTLIMAVWLLAGCNDDITTDTGNREEGEKVTVTINIPDRIDNSGFEIVNTRAQGEDIEEAYSNIYLLAYNTTDRAFTSFSLYDRLGNLTSDAYHSVQIEIRPGTYKFYVMANFNRYLDNTTLDEYAKTASEADIISLIDNFSTDVPITPGNLPMACKATTEHKINSGNNTTTLSADLKYLCSKVRYTIFFDARSGCISEKFGDQRIRFMMEENDYPYIKIRPSSTAGWDDISNAIDPLNTIYWSDRPTLDNNNVAEHYNTTFDTYNELAGNLSAGIYRFDIQGFYRYGSIQNAWEARQRGAEEKLTIIYMRDRNGNKAEIPMKSLYDEYDYIPEYDRGWGTPKWDDVTNDYANSLTGANIVFNTEHKYNNSLTFTLKETGRLTIGIKKEYNVSEDWTCFTNLKLYYKASDDESETIMPISLDRYSFSTDDITITDASAKTIDLTEDLSLWDEKGGALADWYQESCKAWQGVVYLPPVPNSNVKPTLVFPYTFGGLDAVKDGEKEVELFADERYQLTPGKMYDLVMLVKNPDNFDIHVDSAETQAADPASGR